MASNWKYWMKELYKELTTPPTFIHSAPRKQGEKKSGSQNRTDSGDKKKRSEPREDRPDALSRSSLYLKENLSASKAMEDRGQPSAGPPEASDALNSKSSRKSARASNSSGTFQTTAEQEELLKSLHIPSEILERFHIKPYKLERYGSVMRARTHTGAFAIKNTQLPANRIQFIDEALQFATQNEFVKFAPFLHTHQGNPYCNLNGSRFYCTKWIPGSECDFTSHAQLAEAAKTLAEYHKATEGFQTKLTGRSVFDLAEQLRLRQKDLRRYARIARNKNRKNEVDQWVRKNLSAFREQAKQSIAILELPECKEQLAQEQKEAGLCHLDVTSHNLIYTSKNQVVLVDFDLTAFGPRVLDYAHLLRRSLQANNWSRQAAVTQLIAINSIKPLQHEEYLLIQGLLQFPMRVWRVLAGYYDDQVKAGVHDWLKQIEEQEPDRQAFLDLYSRQVTHYY